jgi:4-amino-4-deoxy-L-arabinose transferase-like glycosyltransferase
MPRPPRPALAAVLALAALTRLAVLAPVARRPPDDPDNYLPLARSLAEGRGFSLKGRPTAYRPPLYPLVLAPLVAAFGPAPAAPILGLHLVLGVGTVSLTALAARRWGLSSARGLAAAAIVACDPVLVVQARAVMTETLAAFLLAAALAALAEPSWRGAALGGLAFGLSALCRPSTLPAAALAALALVARGPGPLAGRVARALALALATVAPLAPWAWRNARALGEPVWTTTHGGYTLALANNPVYYAEVLDGPPGAVWKGPNQARWWRDVHRATGKLSEPGADRFLRNAALRLIAERPGSFARASLARLGRFWGVAPAGAVYQTWLRVATAAWTVPLWLALALGLVRRELWRWPRITAPAVVLGLTAVHALFWTDLRMRAPIVPAIALIAATGPPTLARLRRGGHDRPTCRSPSGPLAA